MKTSKVYWSFRDGGQDGENWNILSEEPQSLYSSLLDKKTPGKGNFFECPAFRNVATNTFVIRNPMKSSFSIGDQEVTPLTKAYISSQVERSPSIENNQLFIYRLHYYLFAEDEDMNFYLTSPYFHKAPHLQKAAIVPGSFKPGSWFRQLNLEFNVWEGVNEITFEEGEPLAYITFSPDTRIELQRFFMSPTLVNTEFTLSNSPRWEPNVTLMKRYQRFRRTKMRNTVLKEIKENLI